jgi:5,6-dimethylbenzimidazole synthase
VGLTQPWDFIVVEARDTRTAFYDHVQAERANFAASLDPERASLFEGIKIDGVLESSLSIVVTYDPDRGQPGVLGGHAIDHAGLYSTCLAIQNLWLSATAEGLGVGWVSFYREPFVAELLGIPSPIRPVSWLCVGPSPTWSGHRTSSVTSGVAAVRWKRRSTARSGEPLSNCWEGTAVA